MTKHHPEENSGRAEKDVSVNYGGCYHSNPSSQAPTTIKSVTNSVGNQRGIFLQQSGEAQLLMCHWSTDPKKHQPAGVMMAIGVSSVMGLETPDRFLKRL